jgi:putative transposase
VRFSKRAQDEFGIAIGRYVILPDHLHLFVCLPTGIELSDWIGTLKRILAREVDVSSNDPVWQRGFFDHVLRSTERYAEKWNYIRENPVRAELVKNAIDWPFCGEIVNIYFD